MWAEVGQGRLRAFEKHQEQSGHRPTWRAFATSSWRVTSRYAGGIFPGKCWKIALRGEVGRCPDCAGRLRFMIAVARYS